MALTNEEIIRRPLISEKSTFLANAKNAYSFEVDRRADKPSIKTAIESLYNVKVVGIRTARVGGKPYRTRAGVKTSGETKKAIVVLHEDNKIDLF
jgi:large subunit ribosomal protein L23